ncbi:MAG: hypothetical protein IKM67_00195 [Clostridia bacterium]|nr:hypothetical protein [Clostridia bacterium]
MFGYILANRDALPEDRQKRYKSLYCGLCQQLHHSYGNAARMTLTYDMVFLILLIGGLYEPQESESSAVCMVHPFKKQNRTFTSATEYVADMSVILTYEKLLDDRADENSLKSRIGIDLLDKAYEKARSRQDDKAACIREYLKQLYRSEKSRGGIDEGANLFGKVMGVVFDYGDDMWRGHLSALGEALGRFIYVLDAYADFEKDKKKGRYNPLESNKDESILRVLMGEVAQLYDILPIVQDADIIENIIYSGVWVRYNMEKRRDEK